MSVMAPAPDLSQRDRQGRENAAHAMNADGAGAGSSLCGAALRDSNAPPDKQGRLSWRPLSFGRGGVRPPSGLSCDEPWKGTGVDRALAYLISAGIVSFGVWIIVHAVKSGSPLAWTLLGILPILVGLISLYQEARLP